MESLKKHYIDFFTAHRKNLTIEQAPYIEKIRDEAFKSFVNADFTFKKSEKYKYTDLNGLLMKHQENILISSDISFKIDEVFKCDVPGLDALNLVLINGKYHPEQKKLHVLPNGIIYGSLSEAVIQYPALVEKYYGKIANPEKDGMVALNTLFASEGAFVFIPKNVVMTQHIQLITILMGYTATTSNYRNLFIVEEGATAELIICDHALSSQQFFSNSVTEIYAAPNSKINLTKMQNEREESAHISNIYLNQQTSSVSNVNYLSLNGGFIRNNLEVNLNGEGCESHAYGLIIAGKNQYVDNFVEINHNQPNCQSNQLYKGILEGRAQVSFNGKIYVARNAQKTNAFQSSKNLLLSPDAKTNSKPQLEIYADDVKCSHGATVGQIDQNALFYLRARGIGVSEAKYLLMFAFADEIVKQIDSLPLQERVSELTEQRLKGDMASCKCCALCG